MILFQNKASGSLFRLETIRNCLDEENLKLMIEI